MDFKPSSRRSSLNIWTSDQHDFFIESQMRNIAGERSLLSEQIIAVASSADLPPSVFVASSGTGSQGEVKIYILSKQGMLQAARSLNEFLGVDQSDVWVRVLPKHHVGGLAISARAEVGGFREVEMNQKWHARDFLKFCDSQGVTRASLVPTQVFDLVQEALPAPRSGGRPIEVLIGGGSIDSQLVHRFRKLGWRARVSYGMTEMGSTIAVSSLEDERLRVLPHVSASANDEGLLCLKSETLFLGLIRCNLVSGSVALEMRNQVVYQTMDRVQLIEDGGQYLQVLGRANRQVKVMGELVDLDFLQSVMDGITGRVNDVCILSRDHERRGQEVIAVTENEHLEWVQGQIKIYNERVQPFERVSAVLRVARILRTDLGKVYWAELQSNLKTAIEL
jgi:O-succinylbenzoic acid--CoA ligase